MIRRLLILASLILVAFAPSHAVEPFVRIDGLYQADFDDDNNVAGTDDDDDGFGARLGFWHPIGATKDYAGIEIRTHNDDDRGAGNAFDKSEIGLSLNYLSPFFADAHPSRFSPYWAVGLQSVRLNVRANNANFNVNNEWVYGAHGRLGVWWRFRDVAVMSDIELRIMEERRGYDPSAFTFALGLAMPLGRRPVPDAENYHGQVPPVIAPPPPGGWALPGEAASE